jgi:hypothetical protein
LDEMKKAIEDAGYRVTPLPTERKELLELSGLSVRQAAAKSGVSYPQICHWSRGSLELRPEQEATVRRVLLDAVRERRARIDELVSDRQAVAV